MPIRLGVTGRKGHRELENFFIFLKGGHREQVTGSGMFFSTKSPTGSGHREEGSPGAEESFLFLPPSP